MPAGRCGRSEITIARCATQIDRELATPRAPAILSTTALCTTRDPLTPQFCPFAQLHSMKFKIDLNRFSVSVVAEKVLLFVFPLIGFL
jgi:hypothetical protein